MEKTASDSGATAKRVRVSEFSSVDTRFAVVSVAATPVSGLSELTVAEREVVALVVRGESNRQIAQSRRTSERTVANQMAAIFQKLHVGSRAELILRAQRSNK